MYALGVLSRAVRIRLGQLGVANCFAGRATCAVAGTASARAPAIVMVNFSLVIVMVVSQLLVVSSRPLARPLLNGSFLPVAHLGRNYAYLNSNPFDSMRLRT